MPVNEFERIRAKNIKHNMAYDEYKSMLDKGLSNADIYCIYSNLATIVAKTNNDFRNDIVKIIMRLSEEANEKHCECAHSDHSHVANFTSDGEDKTLDKSGSN